MDSSERGMNPVAMPVINPQKEYCQRQVSNQQPSVLKCCALSTELSSSSRSDMNLACLLQRLINLTQFKDVLHTGDISSRSPITFNFIPHDKILDSTHLKKCAL